MLQGYRTAPDVDGPFKWQVLSELRQLATKHGLGSPAVANMLQFLTADEITPFDIKQIAKLLCTPIQYMMFESTWRRYAEEQGLKNLEVPQQDPRFGAGFPQLMGLPPIDNSKMQARLNPSILAQARGSHAFFHQGV